MYSYKSNLQNPAPTSGAKIEPGQVYFYVVPSDSWSQLPIDHMAYYCCDKSGATTDGPTKMAVSREPWSMAIDLSTFSAGEKRSINIEANLTGGTVLKASDFDFTLSGQSSGTNRVPSISGNPSSTATVGSGYEFQPKASDADSDTLGFDISNLPGWAHFDRLTGKLWGTPRNTDVGLYRDITITVSDGRSSKSLSTFSIDVAENDVAPNESTPPAVPKINSFTTSAGAITKGGSTTLRWSIDGATSVSISPQPGQVQGTSVTVYPSTTTTYKLTARNQAGAATASVSVSVLAGSNDWNVTERPPTLSSPRAVDVSSLGTVNVTGSGLHCSGKVYRVSLANNQDALINMSGNQPLKYPLHVTGGQNVRIVGLHFELATQPGCGIGQLANNPVSEHPNSNIHPRVPGAIALRLQQSGTSYVEGLHIDVRGHEADCIVSRNPDSMTNAQAQSQRNVIIQNTYCSGVEGLGASPIGDGVHGDFFQNQGGDIMNRLVFENVSMRTSQEGIVLHGGGGQPGTQSLVVRRYDYTWDPRYVGDDSYEHFGLAFDGQPSTNWTIEDIRIDDYRDGADYLIIKGQRYGNSPAGNVQPHPEIRSGLPAEGAFALPGKTGVNYVSPHGQ
jgi:hypothetical protein